jgi:hypothetical protein
VASLPFLHFSVASESPGILTFVAFFALKPEEGTMDGLLRIYQAMDLYKSIKVHCAHCRQNASTIFARARDRVTALLIINIESRILTIRLKQYNCRLIAFHYSVPMSL